MQKSRLLLLTLPLLARPAWAAEEGAAKAEAKEAAPAEAAAPATVQQDAFKIRRGFFAASDLGIFLTFGGSNTNDPLLPSRTVSNIQPFLGVTFGYDLVHGTGYSFSLGLKLAMGLTGGAGRVSAGDKSSIDNALLTTRSNDYAIIETGLEAAVSFLVSERLAVTVRADGGGGFLAPDPSKTADVEGAGGPAFAPVVGFGAGIEYFTLLNDFSIGATVRFAGALGNSFIPGLSVTIPIKYTF